MLLLRVQYETQQYLYISADCTLVSADWCQTFSADQLSELRLTADCIFCNPHTSALHPHPGCKHPSAAAAAC